MLAGFWWILLLLAGALFGLGLLVGQGRHAPADEVRFSLTLTLLGHCAALLSLICAALVIHNLQKRQATKWRRLSIDFPSRR